MLKLNCKLKLNYSNFKKKIFTGIVISALVILSSGCASGGSNNSVDKGREIYISAAASLNQAMNELEKTYETTHPGVDLIINFGGSGTLQKQIEQGAPVDLFISAGEQQVDALEEKGLIIQNTRIDFLQNELVLIVPSDHSEIERIEDLARNKIKIAIANPESVPAGLYAKETLVNYGLWEELQPNLVFAKDVTQVRSYVETGNVEAGFVYASDAKSSSKVSIAYIIPADKHKPIVYPAALIKNGKNPEGAKEFLSFLQGSDAMGVFQKYGFK